MNLMLRELGHLVEAIVTSDGEALLAAEPKVDAYFSIDVETDGPIPGPYSMLSFACVYAGSFDGSAFVRPERYDRAFYRELKPISEQFEQEALDVNRLDRGRLLLEGAEPAKAMQDAFDWIVEVAGAAEPVFVAYPLSFDWPWMHWYFTKFCAQGSPFGFSRAFDIKTALAIKAGVPVSKAGKTNLPDHFKSRFLHTHNALDDAIEQADVFANIFGSNTNEPIGRSTLRDK